jgi:hypothetical protein
MLTNCFRVFDSKRNCYIQAEVGLEISDLQLKVDEHRRLREVGIAHLERNRKETDTLRNGLLGWVSTLYMAEVRALEQRESSLNAVVRNLKTQVKAQQIEELTKESYDQVRREQIATEGKYRALRDRITRAASLPELATIDNELRKVTETGS